MKYKKHPERILSNWLSVPFIWGMLIPIMILDFFLEIYHNVCFRLYKIPLVKRSNYLSFDRGKLNYITTLDKANCTYCSYANGLFNYAIAISGKTEEYWCAIKHKDKKGFISPTHHKNFITYGDKNAFKKKYN